MTQKYLDPQISLVIWTGPLSTLVARLRLTPFEVNSLKRSIRKGTQSLLIDLPVNNAEPCLGALKRKLRQCC